MATYRVVVLQKLRGTFEIRATSGAVAKREADEMGLLGWEDPDRGWELLEEELKVERVPPASASAGS
jgi:hypothetical protein